MHCLDSHAFVDLAAVGRMAGSTIVPRLNTVTNLHLLRRHFHDPDCHCTFLAFRENSLWAPQVGKGGRTGRRETPHHNVARLGVAHLATGRREAGAHHVCAIHNEADTTLVNLHSRKHVRVYTDRFSQN